MNWWSKKTVLFFFAGILLLAGVIIAALMLLALVSGDQFCTLVGCVGGLKVELTGLPDSSLYEIRVEFPSGETQILNCGPDATDESIPFSQSCSPNGAFFSLSQDSAPPKNITVTVIVNGKQFLQVFQPEYEKFQPNGEDCPPVCYNATVRMNVSP